MVAIDVLGLLCYAVIALVLLAGTAGVMYTAYVHWLHLKYAHIPSPKRPSFFLGHYPIAVEYLEVKKLQLPVMIYDWYKELGLVFCFFIYHRPLVMCLDSTTVKEVMTNSRHTKPVVEYGQLTTLYGTRFLGRSLLSEWNHARWARKRALFQPAFQRRYLRGLMNVFNESTDRLVDHLLKGADRQTAVCMLDKFNSITLDVIGKYEERADKMKEPAIHAKDLQVEDIDL